MSPEEIILKTCLGLKSSETCLIITDKYKREIAKSIKKSASKICKTKLLEMPELKVNGEEPEESVSKRMQMFDVIVITTKKSLTHTKARKQASAEGARIASMPGITIDTLNRAIDVDYRKMKVLTNAVADRLDHAKIIKIKTKLGTDITFSVEGRMAHGREAGLINKPGTYGNLPEGEAFIAPVEGTANGVFVVDASQGGLGKVSSPIRIHVKDGFAASITGGKEADELLKMLESVNNKDAYNIAEFGIGTNEKAKIIGSTLEDEKVFGSCHVALGNNTGFCGNIDAPIHTDGVITMPTIFFDKEKVMEEGTWLR